MIPSLQARLVRRSNLLLIGFVLSLPAAAQTTATPPADAPAGTTAKCKDNSYYSGAKKGACSHHGGIAAWYGKADAGGSGGASPSGTSAKGASGTGTAPAAAAPSTGTASGGAMAQSSKGPGAATPSKDAAPGGGPGKVWVNTSSKVYHCQGDRWYGRTKDGAYMSEAQAKAAGDRPDHGKPCS